MTVKNKINQLIYKKFKSKKITQKIIKVLNKQITHRMNSLIIKSNLIIHRKIAHLNHISLIAIIFQKKSTLLTSLYQKFSQKN